MTQLCLNCLTVYLIYLYSHFPANILIALFYMPYIYALSGLCTYCPILQLVCLQLYFPFFYLQLLFNLLIAPWFLIAMYLTVVFMCLTTYSFTQPCLPLASFSLLAIYSFNIQSNYLQFKLILLSTHILFYITSAFRLIVHLMTLLSYPYTFSSVHFPLFYLGL